MIRRLLTLAAMLVVGSCAPLPSYAQDNTQLMQDLMAYGAIDQGLPLPKNLPAVIVRDQCDIERDYFNDPARVCGTGGLEILATYYKGTITLSTGWDASSLKDQSILAHELFHWTQDKAGVQAKVSAFGLCMNEVVEKPAYEMMFHWLRDKGLDPWATLNLDPFSLSIILNCQNPWEIQGRSPS